MKWLKMMLSFRAIAKIFAELMDDDTALEY